MRPGGRYGQTQENCDHPRQRLYFWTYEEPYFQDGQLMVDDVLVAGCCDCLDVVRRRVLCTRDVEKEAEDG
jgi:hypothetical protein